MVLRRLEYIIQRVRGATVQWWVPTAVGGGASKPGVFRSSVSRSLLTASVECIRQVC